MASIALGIFLAREGWTLGAGLSLALAACAGVLAIFVRGVALRVLLALAMVMLGSGWYAVRVERVADDALGRVVEEEAAARAHNLQGTETASAFGDGQLVTIEGILLESPRVEGDDVRGLQRFLGRGPVVRFSVAARKLVLDGGVMRETSGTVRVRVDGGRVPGVRVGEAVRVSGLFVPPGAPMNPGETDRRLLWAQEGIEGMIRATGPELVVPMESASWWGLADSARGMFSKVRAALHARASKAVDAMMDAKAGETDASALVRALLIGDLGSGTDELRETFTRLGLLHALTISGFHLAVMALVTLTLLRLTGDRGWVEPIVVAALVLMYAMIVPMDSPIVRSVLMVLLLLAAEAFGRRYDRLTMLAWIGVVVLLVRPLELWSLGFQLTFGLTAMLYVVAPIVESRVLGPEVFGLAPGSIGARDKLWRVVRTAGLANASCWIASTPMVMFRTGLLSPIGVLAGVVIGPIVAIVLWVGYVALLVGMISPTLAAWVGVVVRPIAEWTIALTEWFDRVPLGSMRLPPMSLAWAIVATALGVAFLRRGWWKRARGWMLVGVMGAWLSIEWMSAGLSSRIATRVDMFAVGDGSCLLVRSGDDAILWDAGSLSAGVVARTLTRAVRSVGAWKVPTVVVTHPDLDHYGFLPDLIEPLGVQVVVMGERFVSRAKETPSGAESHLLEKLEAQGVAIRVMLAGDRVPLGSRELVFVSPMVGAPFVRDNEHSLVAAVVPRGALLDGVSAPRADLLLTGDISAEAINVLRRAQPALKPRVMELPHHGSADPASIEWVGAMSPDVVLQSTGKRRANDPRWALVRSGRAWLCTALDGASWAEVGIDGSVRAGSLRGRLD
jgi:competence protein ComEC